MRVATWNVNSVTARVDRLLGWLGTAKPDVLCLQELKSTDEAFPTGQVAELGYQAATWGTGRWNGVAILSRHDITDVRRGWDGLPEFEGVTEPRAITATCGGVRVTSVYVPNGREVGHAHYEYKLAWLDSLTAAVAAPARAGLPYAVLGDFNIAPTDTDVWDISLFTESTHVTPAERAKLADLRARGLTEVLPRALKYDKPYTYWDYRQLAFPKNNGMRIDLVFGNEAFAGAVTDAYVDREERKGKGGSDHAPVVVDLDL
ncbi:exodeoxyribonuclease III [Catenulispora pinistramenti]|uniref:exodeoxyribonuclease III n=1 Tax=Catenulispora pinistramenti TaxID=2705254 RepID=UPI0039B49FC7